MGVVAEIRAKRNELRTRRDALLSEARGIEVDLAALDRCLCILDPAATPNNARYPCRGEVSELLGAVLRAADTPLDSSAQTDAVVAAKGVPAGSVRSADMTSRVLATLADLAKRSLVRRISPDGADRPLWIVAR